MPSCIIPVYSPLLHFFYHLVLEAISASINLVNWSSVWKLILKIDFIYSFIYFTKMRLALVPVSVATAHQASKSANLKIQCIFRSEAVQ